MSAGGVGGGEDDELRPPIWMGVAHQRGETLDLQGVVRPWSPSDRASRVLLIEDGAPAGWLQFGPEQPTPGLIAARLPTPDPAPLPIDPARLPPTTLIICTRRRPMTLQRCLNSVAQGIDGDVEVIVVDNAPVTSATQKVVDDARRHGLSVRTEVEPRRGLSIARNTGIAAANTDIVAFIDDDVLVEPGWLTPLRGGFVDDPDVGIVVGLVPPAELDTAAQLFFERRVPWSRSLTPRRISVNTNRPAPPFPYNAGQIGAGANMAIRKSMLDKLGGFDTALGAGAWTRGGEDLEMYVRVLRAEWDIRFEPASIVWHVHASDHRALRFQLFGYGTGASAYLASLFAQPRRRDVLKALPGLFQFAANARKETLQSAEQARREVLEAVGLVLGAPLYVAERVRQSIGARSRR